MGPRGRSKHKLHSESGTSVGGDSEENDDSTVASASRPRRSRVPKRYLDDDYSPPPTKRRAGNRNTPSDAGDEEEDLKLESRPPQQSSRASVATPSTSRSSKARGRPKKNPTPPRRKSLKQQQEEDVIYMDEDSEEEEESSDDEFIINEEQKDDLDYSDDDLNFSDIKPNIEEEKFCPWIEDPESLPKLELPETSQDIPIPISSTMDAMEIYEILRSYHRTLRITPFTFEDFCAALISQNNSCIMAEVHMALLRVCLKSDDEELTQYSVTETNNSVNIMIHHMDTLTYAEIVRQYIEAYPFTDSCVREAINVENYPYVGYEAKIIVLLFMSYRFLYSSEFKKVVSNMGRFQNDENCRVCGKSSGRVVGCSQCEASFHVECSNLKPFPDILVCNICKKNSVRGVLPLDETIEKEPLRSQPIGRDRYGRFYWFICRRIIVQSLDETEIHYYSTPPQLYQLLQRLDRNYYEKDLCEAIRLRIDEFLEQMTLTVEMTAERREAAIDNVMRKSMIGYEFAETTVSPIYLHKDSMRRMASILRDCSEKVIKEETNDTDIKEEDDTRSSGPLEKTVTFDEDSILPESMLGIFNGSLINTFWSGGSSQEELIQSFVQSSIVNANSLWRMGDEVNDQSFMHYYNYYMRNDMADSFLVRKKAADKKKYMASKFSTIEQFEWVVAKDRQFYGNSVLHNKFVGWTLSKIARKIPTDLMHRKWNEVSKGFEIEISVADDFKKLARCLLQLDAVTRKTIYVQQWWSGLGQTKLERITLDQRETFNKDQQRIKKLETDALAKDLDESFIRVNYAKPKWPNTYILRQKGETYRNAGKGMMGGWAWVAKKYNENWVSLPKKPILPLSDGTLEKKKDSLSTQKARRLENLVTAIVRKRDSNRSGSGVLTFDLTNKCYSPSCPNSKTFTIPNAKCYSTSCRNGILAEAQERHIEEEKSKKEVIGEDKPWPIPEIQTFATKRGSKSLFILQKNSRILRQMILTAGCQQVYMPGFSAGIKSNLLIWPYPAPRPTLDLCWKWQTLNSKSLHSVALQLKIMWSSIKWNEFEPDDTHPDRRVVIDTPSHDERRRIIRHKEMPPYGQYERYELEIEIIPLYDEQEDEDDSWLSRNRSTDCSQRTASRKKRPQRHLDNRQATAIRKEWVDGVTLKVYEIKDYWKWVRMEAEKVARKKMEAAKKLVKAKEDAERQRLMMLQRPVTVPRAPSVALERTNVPYMGASRRSAIGLGQDSNGSGRNLEKYNNTSHLPPRVPSMYYPSSAGAIPRVQPNPVIRRIPVPSNSQLQQTQYTTRVAAGSDNTSNGASLVAQGSFLPSRPLPNSLHHNQQQQQFRQVTNGQHYQDGVFRNGGGVRVVQQKTPMQIAQRRLVLTPVREPTNPTRQALPIAEESLGSNSSRNDPSNQQNPISRNDFTSTGSQRTQQPVRQFPSGQMMVRASPGTTGNVLYLKSTMAGTQKMMIRRAAGSSEMNPHQGYPPGTVLDNGQSAVNARPIGVHQSPQIRQMISPGGTQRYVRVQNSITPRQTDQIVRRVIHAGQQRPIESFQQSPSQSQQNPPVPQNPRFIIQGRTQISKNSNGTTPNEATVTQMTQQHPQPHQIVENESEVNEFAHTSDSREK